MLDYLMGILILIEGHYYKGDWIAIRGPLGAVEGEVEDIGLRKTTIRDNAGTVHNVSNGLIRLSSNLTRVYSVASAEVQVLTPRTSTGRSRSRLAWATSCRPIPVGRSPVRCAGPDGGDRAGRGRRDRAGFAARAAGGPVEGRQRPPPAARDGARRGIDRDPALGPVGHAGPGVPAPGSYGAGLPGGQASRTTGSASPATLGGRARLGFGGYEPSRNAIAAASPRVATPSLPMMFETWTPAVLSLMNRRSAIWRFVRPSATSASTSRSRGEPERILVDGRLGAPSPAR